MRKTALAGLAVALTLGAGAAEAVVYTSHTETHSGAFALAPRTYAGQPRSSTVTLPMFNPATLGALGVFDGVVVNINYHVDAFPSVRNNTGYEPVDALVNGVMAGANTIFAGPGLFESIGPLLFLPAGTWTNIVINNNTTLHLPPMTSVDVNRDVTLSPTAHPAYLGIGTRDLSANMDVFALLPGTGSVLNMEWFGNESVTGTLSITYQYRTGVEETTEVPEPISLSLLALGCGALVAARRRQPAW